MYVDSNSINFKSIKFESHKIINPDSCHLKVPPLPPPSRQLRFSNIVCECQLSSLEEVPNSSKNATMVTWLFFSLAASTSSHCRTVAHCFVLLFFTGLLSSVFFVSHGICLDTMQRAPRTSQRHLERTLPPCPLSLKTNPDVWNSIHAHLTMPCYFSLLHFRSVFVSFVWHDLCIYQTQWTSVVSRLP